VGICERSAISALGRSCWPVDPSRAAGRLHVDGHVLAIGGDLLEEAVELGGLEVPAEEGRDLRAGQAPVVGLVDRPLDPVDPWVAVAAVEDVLRRGDAVANEGCGCGQVGL